MSLLSVNTLYNATTPFLTRPESDSKRWFISQLNLLQNGQSVNPFPGTPEIGQDLTQYQTLTGDSVLQINIYQLLLKVLEGVAAGTTAAVPTVTVLRQTAGSTLIPDQIINTLGYYAIGDLGQGSYYYDATDHISPDNGGSVIIGSDGARFKLLISGNRLDIRQWGAVGDDGVSVALDNAAFQNAITYMASIGGKAYLFVPYGKFHITQTLGFAARMVIEGVSAGSKSYDPSVPKSEITMDADNVPIIQCADGVSFTSLKRLALRYKNPQPSANTNAACINLKGIFNIIDEVYMARGAYGVYNNGTYSFQNNFNAVWVGSFSISGLYELFASTMSTYTDLYIQNGQDKTAGATQSITSFTHAGDVASITVPAVPDGLMVNGFFNVKGVNDAVNGNSFWNTTFVCTSITGAGPYVLQCTSFTASAPSVPTLVNATVGVDQGIAVGPALFIQSGEAAIVGLDVEQMILTGGIAVKFSGAQNITIQGFHLEAVFLQSGANAYWIYNDGAKICEINGLGFITSGVQFGFINWLVFNNQTDANTHIQGFYTRDIAATGSQFYWGGVGNANDPIPLFDRPSQGSNSRANCVTGPTDFSNVNTAMTMAYNSNAVSYPVTFNGNVTVSSLTGSAVFEWIRTAGGKSVSIDYNATMGMVEFLHAGSNGLLVNGPQNFTVTTNSTLNTNKAGVYNGISYGNLLVPGLAFATSNTANQITYGGINGGYELATQHIWRVASTIGITALPVTDAMTLTNSGQLLININQGSNSARAMLEGQSTNKGALLFPMSTANRDAIVAPPTGLEVFVSSGNDSNGAAVLGKSWYDGTRWISAPQRGQVTISAIGNNFNIAAVAVVPCDIFFIQLQATNVLVWSGLYAGFRCFIRFRQDGTGGRTITLPANSLTPGGSLGLSAGVNAVDLVEAVSYDGTSVIFTVIAKNVS